MEANRFLPTYSMQRSFGDVSAYAPYDFGSPMTTTLRLPAPNHPLLDEAIQAVAEAEADGRARIAATPGMHATYMRLAGDIGERMRYNYFTQSKFKAMFAGRLFGYDVLGDRYYTLDSTSDWPYNNAIYVHVGGVPAPIHRRRQL